MHTLIVGDLSDYLHTLKYLSNVQMTIWPGCVFKELLNFFSSLIACFYPVYSVDDVMTSAFERFH